MTFRNKFESKEGVRLSGGMCVVCGWDEQNINTGESLVIGAHARPFKGVSDYDKRDNIFALCPNHHAEYDAGNITIDSFKLISICANSGNPCHLKKLIGRIDHIQKGYFDYHKKNIFDRG